jgi:hypothetical protein
MNRKQLNKFSLVALAACLLLVTLTASVQSRGPNFQAMMLLDAALTNFEDLIDELEEGGWYH